jgi:hypothetical protein
MTLLKREEARKLAAPLLVLIALAGAGAGIIWYADRVLLASRQALTAAQAERTQNREKLSRISEEEREVREKAEVYRQLKDLHIIGPERRLEWADTITRVRGTRELLDLRFTVAPRKLLSSVQGKPANVQFYSSAMSLNMLLLHEGDLVRLLGDLRDAGNAYYAVQGCALTRLGQPAAPTTIAPRLSGECSVELITIIDPGGKT